MCAIFTKEPKLNICEHSKHLNTDTNNAEYTDTLITHKTSLKVMITIILYTFCQQNSLKSDEDNPYHDVKFCKIFFIKQLKFIHKTVLFKMFG